LTVALAQCPGVQVDLAPYNAVGAIMRNRMASAGCALLLSMAIAVAMASSLSLAAGPATAPAANERIKQLIQLLGSPDPTERDQAQASLIQIGEPARADLKAAQAGDDPAIAQGAAAVILQLPWYTADDPPAVKQLMADYGSQSVDKRCAVVDQLGNMPDGGFRVLFRIIANEPSDEVRWAIVAEIEAREEPAQKVAARSVPASADSPPLLALAGWAWFDFDPNKGLDYYQRSFDQLKRSPQAAADDPDSPMLGPLGPLYVADVALHHYDQAADVLRVQLHQFKVVPPRNSHYEDLLFRLFALHADYGPLTGYADDCALAGDKLNEPLFLYCRSRIAQRMMQPEQASALRTKALAAAAGDLDVAEDTAVMLTDYGWDDLATQQWMAIENTLAGGNGPNGDDLSDAHFALAAILARDGDDKQAADEGQTGLDLLSPQARQALETPNAAGSLTMTPEPMDNILIDQRWWALKAARGENNAKKVAENLDALVKANPNSTDIVQDAVQQLTAAGRPAEAQAMFNRLYVKMRSAVDADPGCAMYMNNLAWFCAQSGQRLEEADTLARRAVAAMPNEASYIDTLAYCEYKLHRPAEAVRLETIALSIDRNSFVMIEALDRYRAAEAGG